MTAHGSGWRRRHCIASLMTALTGLALPDLGHGANTAREPADRPAADTQARRLVVIGDSLSAEYGLKRGSGWVALLQARLASAQPPVEVINASISGDTTAGGLARLPELLKSHRPTHVVIELGANDALRGLPLAATEANLRAMVGASRAAGARVMLIGMQVPPNYGPQYTRDFSAIFTRVAKIERAALVPFLLKGIADDQDALRWFQADRIHPNESAHPRLLDNVWLIMKPWLPA